MESVAKELIGKWNYYFLRYAAGTMLGAYVLLFLVDNIHPGQMLSVKYGLQFPVMHYEITWMSLLVGGFAFCYVSSAPIFVFHVLRGQRPRWNLYLSLIPIFQVIPVFVALRSSDQIVGSYRKIATARAKRWLIPWRGDFTDEFIESYRTIREHGNAFLILLYEIILGVFTLILLRWHPILLIPALFLWILPAGFVWEISTKLELSLANENPVEG